MFTFGAFVKSCVHRNVRLLVWTLIGCLIYMWPIRRHRPKCACVFMCVCLCNCMCVSVCVCAVYGINLFAYIMAGRGIFYRPLTCQDATHYIIYTVTCSSIRDRNSTNNTYTVKHQRFERFSALSGSFKRTLVVHNMPRYAYLLTCLLKSEHARHVSCEQSIHRL